MVIPIVTLVSFIEIFDFNHTDAIYLGFIVSPAMVPFFLEVGAMDEIFNDYIWAAILFNLMLYSGLLYLVRAGCLQYAACLLGRSEDDWN